MEQDTKSTIIAMALPFLCKIDYYEDKTKKPGDDNRVEKDHKYARSVGFSYKIVLQAIKKTFPNCKTTVACLRWYSTKINAGDKGYTGLTLPQRRPRSKKGDK